MNKFKKIAVSELYTPSGKMIKNFIVSNDFVRKDSSFNHPYIFDGFAFAINTKGTSVVRINMIKYDITPNMLIVIQPGAVVEFLSLSDDNLAEFLIFSEDFLADIKFLPSTDIIEKIESNPCLKITNKETSILLSFHSFITKQYNRITHEYRVEMIKTLLFAMLIEVASLYNIARPPEIRFMSHNAHLFRQLMKLLFKHHKEERRVSFYAKHLCLSPKYLSKVMKQVAGKTVFELINEFVINTSKALLKSSEMNIVQISEVLNFPNPSFFGHFFKKHTTMTPKEYRDGFKIK